MSYSKTFFRELPGRAAPAAPIDWWWGGVAALCMVALLGLMHLLDEHGKRVFAAQAVAADATSATTRELLPKIRAAYEQGQRDALAAAAADANGLQIASTCMAWWYDASLNKRALRERVCGAAKAAGGRP